MKKLFSISVFVSLLFLLCPQAPAEVPQMINYQGKLTTNAGAPVNDTLQMIFTIYSDSNGTTPLWTETQSAVVVEKGVFNVLLGSVNPIPYSVFDGSIRYLGVKVGDDPEITPRKPIVSVAYAYKSFESDTADYARAFFGTVENADKVDGLHASSTPTAGYLYPLDGSAKIPNTRLYTGSGNGLDADLLDGQQASAFLSTANDYGRSGVATDLYEGTSTLSNRYVNTDKSDSVSVATNTDRTAFLGRMNFTSGTAERHGIEGICSGSSTDFAHAIGVYGKGVHTVSGEGVGGWFEAGPEGTGKRVGVAGFTGGGSPDITAGNTGVYGLGYNNSTGTACGGRFETSIYGSGNHYGVYDSCISSSSAYAIGIYSTTYNNSTGNAFSGYFKTLDWGTGSHYGVYTESYASSSSPSYGSYNYSSNTSSGDAYGGYFSVSSSGTGYHRGLYATVSSNSLNFPIGVYGYAENTSLGSAFGGMFSTSSAGTGIHYGLQVGGYGASSSLTCGLDASAQNTSSGNVYAGSFYASSSGTGIHYGVYATASGGSANYAGYFVGNFLATGGTKSAAVKIDNGEYRLLYCQESTENWFEDFGKARLTNGVAKINIDPLYAQTVNTSNDYYVFPVPEGDCKGLFVTNKTPTSFEIKELQGGTSNAPFSYRIVAKRKGYEDLRLEKMAGPTPEEVMAERATHQAELEKERTKMEEERVKREKERELR